MKKFEELNSDEKDYVTIIYEWANTGETIEVFYEDNFVECDNCGEITFVYDLCDNDLLTWGGEIKICETCIDDGWGR